MNRRNLGAAVLMLAITGLPSMEALAQKEKKKGDKSEPAPALDASKLKSGEFVGVLKSTPGANRMFTIEVEQTKLVPTGKGGAGAGGGGNTAAGRILQLQNQLQQAQGQVASARTPQQRQQAANRVRQLSGQLQQSIARLQGGGGAGGSGAPAGFKYEKSKVTVEFQVAENAKIRTANLPETFDEKGNIKKYTAKEMADLKGKDKSLPGYESSLEKLEVGQTVKVTQSIAPKSPAKGPASSKEEMPSEDEVALEKSKQVKLIVILTEAAPAMGKGLPKKKK
jgi:hypothetical protein